MDDAPARPAKTVFLISFILGHMDMDPPVVLPGEVSSLAQGFIGQGEGSMETNHGTQEGRSLAISAGEGGQEAFVLLQAFLGLAVAITIRHLIAEDATYTGLDESLGNHREGTRTGIGAGMMINQGGRSVGDGIQQAGKGAIFNVLWPEGAIQAPPETLENLYEVGRGRILEGHAAGEGTIGMRVGADEARHDEASTGVQVFSGGVRRAQGSGGTNGSNNPLLHEDRSIVNDGLYLIKGDDYTMTNQQVPTVRHRAPF